MNLKPLLTLIFCLLLSGTFIHAQWTTISPNTTTSSSVTLDIAVIDSLNVWSFPFAFSGSGTNEYFKTTDGGLTWENGFIAQADSAYLNLGIFALNDSTVWINQLRIPDQDRSKLYKTTDGGQTWTEQFIPFSNKHTALIQVHFFNKNEGFAFSETFNGTEWSVECYYTTDGGNTWQIANSPTSSNERIWVSSLTNEYEAIGNKAWFGTTQSVFGTIDKGKNWFAVPLPDENRSWNVIAFKDEYNGMIISGLDGDGLTAESSLAYRTSDGGKSWFRVPNPPLASVVDLEYVPGSEGVYIRVYL